MDAVDEEYLLVESKLQLQLAGRQHEVLAHDGAGLRARLGRRVLHLADAQRHRAPAHEIRYFSMPHAR